jgi:hypothetical protein
MLAFLYFSFSLAGVSQSSFSTSRYHASNGSSASGNRPQKSRNGRLETIRMETSNCTNDGIGDAYGCGVNSFPPRVVVHDPFTVAAVAAHGGR